MGEIIVGIPHTERTAILGPPPKPNREEYPYQGSINFQGILIYIENLPGSIREGRDTNGNPWRVKMRNIYGEIPGTRGADGDPVDVYIGDNPSAPMAYILHQNHYFGTEHEPPATYDEDKVMLGFSTLDEALGAYAAHFNHPIWMPGVTPMPVDELKTRMADGELELGAAVVKARTRKYKRRIPKPGGGYRYIYDEPAAEKPKRAAPAPAPAPERKPPGSQLPPAVQARLRALGISKLPEAAIPISDITVNLSQHRIHQRAVISWRDRAGRRQNGYTPTFHERNAKAKWARVLQFRGQVPALKRKFGRVIGREEHGGLAHQGAVVAAIIAATGLRPGTEASLATHGHAGVTTLSAEHLSFRGNTVTFEFVGKSGKTNTATIRNKAVANALREYASGGGRLFDGGGALLAARALLPEGMHLKDFRTVIGTNAAMKALDGIVPPPPLTGNKKKDKRLLLKAIKKASVQVATTLNNTPAVARHSYIHPMVFEEWARKKAGAQDALWQE